MQRVLLWICISISLVGHASAVEFTHALTPQLADVQTARLLVYVSPERSCDVPKSTMVAVAQKTLSAAGIDSVDGFDPSRTVGPKLEIHIDALQLLRKCYLTVKIILRTDVTRAAAERCDCETVWGDVGGYVYVSNGFVDHVSDLLRSRLRLMIGDIERARAKFPAL